MKTTKPFWTLFVLLASTCGLLEAAPSRQDLKSATFNDVTATEKLNSLGASLFGGMATPGTLVVTQSALGDAIRTLGLQGSALRGRGPRIAEIDKTISYALSRFRSAATEPAAPDTDPH